MAPRADRANKGFCLTPETYEQMSNFQARLPREGAFLRDLFGDRVGSVLDCGCGPGHHAAMLADWGLQVLGIDASAKMIRRARQLHGQSPTLSWRVLRFDQLDRISRQFDAAICMGNSLMLSGGKADIAATLRRMRRRLNRRGKLVLHLLNLHRYDTDTLHVRSTHRVRVQGRQWLTVKLLERDARRAHMRLVFVDPSAKQPGRCVSSRPFAVFDRAWITASLRNAGFYRVRMHGAFDRRPYRPSTSPDMLVTAEARPDSQRR